MRRIRLNLDLAKLNIAKNAVSRPEKKRGRQAVLAVMVMALTIMGSTIAAIPIVSAQSAPKNNMNAAASPASKSAPIDPKLEEKIRIYKAKLAAYFKARKAYRAQLNRYWAQIKKKRAIRKAKKRRGETITLKDYVLTQPPKYTGPKWPKNPVPPPKKAKAKKKKPGPPRFGTVKDFLRAAKKHYNFVPRHTDEKSFKKAYAREALRLGLTAEQVVGVFALETGGLGPYNRQAGVFLTDQNCKPVAPYGRPISSALGYAQLLSANSSAMTAKFGNEFADRLENMAKTAKPARAKHLHAKAKIVRRMVKDIKRSIRRYRRRDGWREYVAFARTSKGRAVHALNLDADIGPMLQVYKLHRITEIAKRKGHAYLSAAKLELLNLVGFGRGLEMLRPGIGKAATANFLSRRGYERNPVVAGKTIQQLIDKLASIIARNMKKCGSKEFVTAFNEAFVEVAAQN